VGRWRRSPRLGKPWARAPSDLIHRPTHPTATIDFAAATTAIGQSATDIAAFLMAQTVAVGAALALLGGVVLVISVLRKKAGLKNGLRKV
jgi:hypothetical protein